jgi:tetratricopeptide (TPR) repeat protein
MDEHKTVFISYRRTNIYIARSIYLDLRANGYDAFLDYEGLDSGDWKRVILNQIEARAHFVLLLTPTALERCVNSDDMLRLEIEHAIDTRRNIVPLIFQGFDYKLAEPYLVSDKLKLLPKFNGMNMPDDYFDEAMTRLRTRFLTKPVEGVLIPAPAADQSVVQASIQQMEAAPLPTPEQVKAEEFLERGKGKFLERDNEGAIEDFTEAINLDPQFAEAYDRRALVRERVGDYEGAVADYTEVIRLNPHYASAYLRRGDARDRDDYQGRIADYTEVIRLGQNMVTTLDRGFGNTGKNKARRMSAEHETLLRSAMLALAYDKRAGVRSGKVDYDGALADYDEAIRLRPEDAPFYFNRASTRFQRGDYDAAISDYETVLRLDPKWKGVKETLEMVRQEKAKKARLDRYQG